MRKINLDYQEPFFTADVHFGHKAMVNHHRYVCGGQFVDTEHMDRHLIERWNATVPPHGIVFLLGDVSFRNQAETLELLTQLNGEIHLVQGNHDKGLNGAVRSFFRGIYDYLELRISGGGLASPQFAVLCHYAFRSWNRMHYGAWNLHGHSHGNLVPCGKQLDVGVDCSLVTPDLRPLRFQEIADFMALQNFVAVDHHYREGDPQFEKND